MASNSKKNTRKKTPLVMKLSDLRSELVFRRVKNIVRNKKSWSGTMTNLISVISESLTIEEKRTMPKSPAALRMVVNKVVNRLRNRGISVKFGRTTDHTRTRFVRFAR